MLKLMSVLMLSFFMMPGAFAGWHEQYKIENGQIIKIVACTNGISYHVPVTKKDLDRGFKITDKKGSQYWIQTSNEKFEKGGKRYAQILVTEDTVESKIIARIVLDYHPDYGRVTADDFPVSNTPLKLQNEQPTELTGLVQVEHFDPKADNRTFYVWHFLEKEKVVTENRRDRR